MKKKERSWFLKTFDPRMWFYDFGKWSSALFIWLVVRTKRLFINKKKPKGFDKGRYIIACNHVAFSDYFVVSSSIPRRRICCVSTDRFVKKGTGWFFKSLGTIFIEEKGPLLKAFKQVNNMLNRGHIVLMFPEGSISNDAELQQFKGGVAMMAGTAKADILPIYIAKRKGLQRKVSIVGEKLKYDELFKSSFPTKEEINKASELLMQKEKELETYYKEKYLNS